MSDGAKFQELHEKIYLLDRVDHSVYPAWDTINALVNEVYGIDLGDALNLWEAQHGGAINPAPMEGKDARDRNKTKEE